MQDTARPARKHPFSAEDLRLAMRLYAVTDSAWLGESSLAACVAEALRGGATFVQLREKDMSTADLVSLAREIMPMCSAAGVPFVINDDVHAARLACADGVHVGQDDLACEQARRLLGPHAIVGVSVQTVGQALRAQAAGASYLGVGAMLATSTKSDAVIVSPQELSAICSAVSIPVVAIGGMNANTISCLKGTGVDGVAVVSALFAAENIEQAANQLARSVGEVLDL